MKRYRLDWWTGSRWETITTLSCAGRPTRAFIVAVIKSKRRKTVSPHLAKRLRATPCPVDAPAQIQLYVVDPETRNRRAVA